MRKSEIIETQKSAEEIRNLIVLNSEKPKFFTFHNTYSKNYIYRIDGNLIHLTATKLVFWPHVELELNEFIEPRLKINYSGFIFFIILYSTFAIPILFGVLELITWEDIIGSILLIGIFSIIPFYANYVQRNTRNWLIELLNEN
jgi:hypothetical protein